jgi:hypothetical protein
MKRTGEPPLPILPVIRELRLIGATEAFDD